MTRKDERVDQVIPVKLRFPGVDDFLRSYTENLSLGGIFVRTHVKVAAGSRLDLWIELSPGKGLRATGEVVWCRDAAPGQEAGLGVRFMEMDPASKQWLDAAVKAFLAKATAALSAPKPEMQHVVSGTDLTGNQDALDMQHDEADVIVGIDLGTSNSCACVVINNKAQIIDLSDADVPGTTPGNRTLPSVVSYDDSGRPTVGMRAWQNLATNAKRTVFGAKRFIGRTYDSPAVQKMLSRFPYHIVQGAGGRVAIDINGRPLALTTVSAQVLRAIREKCEKELKRPLHSAVITVPAYYNDNQRSAVVAAGGLAGFKVERILNEPTAAAIAYGFSEGEPRRILVYDLGGGTFDVSIMLVKPGSLDVISTAGDTFLGGEDFDSALVQHVCAVFEKKNGKQLSQNHAALAVVKDAAEKAKRRLSTNDKAMVTVREAILRDGTKTRLEIEVTRAEFEKLVEPLVARTFKICQLALTEAKMTLDQLSDVLLVGGQTRMPHVQKRVSEFFKRTPRCDLNPDEVVALGAGLLPHLTRRNEIQFRDVLPMSIGVAVDGRMNILIPRNTPVPHQMKFTIGVPANEFATFKLELWQGDSAELFQNEKLGDVRVDGLEPGTANPAPIEIKLSLAADCLLRVEITNTQSGQTQQVLLQSEDLS